MSGGKKSGKKACGNRSKTSDPWSDSNGSNKRTDFGTKLDRAVNSSSGGHDSRYCRTSPSNRPQSASRDSEQTVNNGKSSWYKESAEENNSSANIANHQHVNKSESSMTAANNQSTNNQADPAAAGAQAGAEAAKADGFFSKIGTWTKKTYNANRVKVGLVVGVAATLAGEAAISAYKTRQEKKNSGGAFDGPMAS
jgi:hypothetical protein